MDGGLPGNERPRTRPSGAPRRPIRRPALTPPATLRAIRYRALLHGWVFRPREVVEITHRSGGHRSSCCRANCADHADHIRRAVCRSIDARVCLSDALAGRAYPTRHRSKYRSKVKSFRQRLGRPRARDRAEIVKSLQRVGMGNLTPRGQIVHLSPSTPSARLCVDVRGSPRPDADPRHHLRVRPRSARGRSRGRAAAAPGSSRLLINSPCRPCRRRPPWPEPPSSDARPPWPRS